MIHEQEILIITDFIERRCGLPSFYDHIEFEKMAYRRWAAEEAIQILLDHPFEDAEIMIREFAITLRAMAEREKPMSKLFEYSAQTLDEILLLL